MDPDFDTRFIVTPPAATHPGSGDVEMVERKGRGHPDTICDALADRTIRRLPSVMPH
jgi:S-adenosylmethionine synthetase